MNWHPVEDHYQTGLDSFAMSYIVFIFWGGGNFAGAWGEGRHTIERSLSRVIFHVHFWWHERGIMSLLLLCCLYFDRKINEVIIIKKPKYSPGLEVILSLSYECEVILLGRSLVKSFDNGWLIDFHWSASYPPRTDHICAVVCESWRLWKVKGKLAWSLIRHKRQWSPETTNNWKHGKRK